MKNLPLHLTPEMSRRNSIAVVRAQLALLAKGNIDQVQGWLDRIANGNSADFIAGHTPTLVAGDPAKALDLFLKLLEFSVPKLSRAEVAVTDPNKEGVAQLTIAELQDLLRQARTLEGQCEALPATQAAR